MLPDPIPTYLAEGSKWSFTALYAAARLDASIIEVGSVAAVDIAESCGGNWRMADSLVDLLPHLQ